MKKILNYFLGIIFFALSSLYYLELLIIKLDTKRANTLLEQLEGNEIIAQNGPWELMLRGSNSVLEEDTAGMTFDGGIGGSSGNAKDEEEYPTILDEQQIPGEDVIDSYLIRRQMVTGTPIKKIVGEHSDSSSRKDKKKPPVLRQFKRYKAEKGLSIKTTDETIFEKAEDNANAVPSAFQPLQPQPQPQQNEEADQRTYKEITHRIIQLLMERKELLSSHKSTTKVDEVIQWNELKRCEPHVQDLTGKTFAEVTSFITELTEEQKLRLEMKMDTKEVEKEMARMKAQLVQLGDQRSCQEITQRIIQLLLERRQLLSSHQSIQNVDKVDELILWNEGKRREARSRDDLLLTTTDGSTGGTGGGSDKKTYEEISMYIDKLVEERKERVVQKLDWGEVGREISRMNEVRWKLR